MPTPEATPSRGAPAPDLTVVLPVLNGVGMIERCFDALAASDLPEDRWEVVVVDDGSTDGTPDLARARGHRVVRVPDGPRGPGAARNLGATRARGSLLVFVDADVCVHPDVLRRFRDLFDAEPDVGAAFGAYDEHPADPDFLSQYRNLYHRWVHLRGAGDAETFWAGCGAVRRVPFLELGGFDTARFPRPQIEDIELGYRLRDAGWRIVLDPSIEATHLKRWRFGGMVRTDLFDRGMPWMRLLLDRPRRTSLNIGLAERARVAGVGLACLLVAIGAALGAPWVALAAVVPLAGVVASNRALFRWFARLRGWGFALKVVPLYLLFHLLSGLAVVGAVVGRVVDRGAAGADVTPDPLPSTLAGESPATAGSRSLASRQERR